MSNEEESYVIPEQVSIDIGMALALGLAQLASSGEPHVLTRGIIARLRSANGVYVLYQPDGSRYKLTVMAMPT